MTSSAENTDRANTGLCFREAIEAIEADMLSEDEYFRHLIAHFRGIRHPFDYHRAAVYQLMVTEPVASSIRRHALQDDYEDFRAEEVEICQNLFQSCAEGNTGQFMTFLDELSHRHALVLHPVTVIAATKGYEEIFRLCVPLALEANIDLDTAVRHIIFQHPDILDFLLGLNWQNIQSSPKALNQFVTSCLLPGEGHKLEVLRWILDHGAKISLKEYQLMAMSPPRPDVLTFLLVRRFVESIRSKANVK
jgi:hypothetical protein